jgi:hypothetical protein
VQLRETPGLPEPDLRPPVIAAVGDPFADLRVVHLLARLPRGVPVRLRDVIDRLEAEHLDWSFSRPVVLAAIVQLQANWRADYRTTDGIDLRDGPTGPELVIEDGSRVDPWIVRQVERRREACLDELRRFASEDAAAP